MAIVKMKRLRLIGLTEQRDEMLARLLHVGCVEVTEPTDKMNDPEWAALVKKDVSSLSDYKAQVGAVTSAMAAVKEYAKVKTGLFIKRPVITEEALFDQAALENALRNASEINERTHEIAQIFSQENRLNAQRASLVPWTSLGLPLECRGTQSTDITYGVCPAAASVDNLRSALAEAAPMAELYEASVDKEQHYLLLVSHKEETADAVATLRTLAFGTTNFKDMSGTPDENIDRLDARLKELSSQRDAAIADIVAHKDCYWDLGVCSDCLNQEVNKQVAREKFLTDGTIFFLEGWVTVPEISELEKEMGAFSCAYELADPQEEETVPTKLKNPKWMRPINMVTEMYSLPSYDGIDPNPLIFFSYIFFFGFMFADIAYGIIIWAICFIICKKYKPKGTMGYMFGLGQYLGISTTLVGFCTGGFFGDVITVFSENFMSQTYTLPALISPLNDPMGVLIIAVILGAIQMFFGQCVHIYMEIRDGHPLEGFLDVIPWWIVFAGIGTIALAGNPWVLAAGGLALILTQGRHKKGIIGKLFGGIASWYDITSWLGDILSYSRLMALMLATTVIASVMNILGSLPGNVFVFFIVFLIGHVFNIGVNIIGTYVHAARLHYLEFFGKFYKDGGTPFRPLAYQTKYVDIEGIEE